MNCNSSDWASPSSRCKEDNNKSANITKRQGEVGDWGSPHFLLQRIPKGSTNKAPMHIPNR